MTALDGLRILDMTQYEAGPSATQALAWFGADVVKVEPPGIGDPGRGPDEFPRDYFMYWNCNKRSIVIDLTTTEGRDILLQLAPNFDVFVENYGPGVVEKLDVDYEVVRKAHPGIIYASVKGFGLTGPYSDRKCFDGVAQAAAGALSTTGYSDGEPLLPGPTTGDSGTGVQLALAILAAYVQKLRTGEGQRIEISMQEAMTYYMRTRVASAPGWGEEPAPRNGNGAFAVNNLYSTAGGGPNDYVMIMAITPRMFGDLCVAMERPELVDDDRFKSGRGRAEHSAELKAEIAAWTSQYTKYEVAELLATAGVPGGPVLDTADLLRDPHLVERGFVKTIQHPEHGEVPMLGWAPRLSASEVEIEAAPAYGAHSAEVLSEELGFDADQIATLRASGVIGGV
ncbi:MAG: crotonobetainyl-CoA:carnitine CoA-transferase CaiB-like acyl-CoA transferase [Candidatus Poriferisodalaceae bacterium]|jgi:crotonobetainyl-CoA:carnitine CoA-transferase CaiB-like acyl-CoA transferase